MAQRPIVSDHPSRFILLVGLLLVGASVTAQSPRDRPEAPRAGTGVIRGRVVRADTGEPIRRVQVRVDEWSTGDRSGPASTMTDAEGRYELPQLPPGRYLLKATRGGYVELAYGQRRPFERGRPVELEEGAILKDIDFALPPGGVVAGRVVDEMGEPVAQASVSLARRRYVDGERQFVGERGDSTDDRGEFRIFGVPPGDYVMIARLEVVDFGSRDRVRYVPTYYPGTPSVSEAQRIAVGPGQEVSGIMVTLAHGTTATVRGVVRGSEQASLGRFTFVTARHAGGAQTNSEIAPAIAGGDGSFAIAGLLPGTYVVEARSASGAEFGSVEVAVGGTDVTGVTLMLSQGAIVRGRIRFESREPPKDLRPSQVVVMATFLDHQIGGSNIPGPPVVRYDWSFELHGLRGRGFIRAATLNDWAMKRVLREDIDVTDTPLDFSTDIDNLEIELTQRVTTISGGVSDDRGRIALDATVIVFADDPEKWGPHSRFIESARPNQQGRFSIHGLPAGKYVAIAVGYLEPGEERDPDILGEWRPRGTHFTLEEGGTHALELSLSGR